MKIFKMNVKKYTGRLTALLTCAVFSLPTSASSSGPDSWRGCGAVDYSWGADALQNAFSYSSYILTMCVGILYAGCAVLSIVSAFQIYIKMNTGEGEIMKSVLYLVGGILFMLGASFALPAFFGFNYTPLGN